jgi:ribosomal protein S18 acetylase RimI-like enzyme
MILKDFQQEKIEQALEANMIGKFLYLPERNPNMDVVENENMLVINSRCKADMFNIICKTKTSNSEILQQTMNLFINAKLPFAWWLGFSGEPEDLQEVLENQGLCCNEHELGMYIALDELPNEADNLELSIVEVTDKSNLRDFAEVIMKLMPVDACAVKNFYMSSLKPILVKDSCLKLFVGYFKNEPVATSALFCGSGVAGIWDIITLPEARGKGFGTSMTLNALQAGRNRGYKIGVLTASHDGLFVYKKMGFKSLKKYLVCNYQGGS